MYRHLSPKPSLRDKGQDPNKLKAVNSQPIIHPSITVARSAAKKDSFLAKQSKPAFRALRLPAQSDKDVKQLGQLLSLNNNKIKGLPIPPKPYEKPKAMFIQTKKNQKISEYYENKVKYINKRQHQKGNQTSDSGDSYKSQGFGNKRLGNNSSHEDAKSAAQKIINTPKKNLVTAHKNHQASSSIKLPYAKRSNNLSDSQEDKTNGKKIISFGSRKGNLISGINGPNKLEETASALNNKKLNQISTGSDKKHPSFLDSRQKKQPTSSQKIFQIKYETQKQMQQHQPDSAIRSTKDIKLFSPYSPVHLDKFSSLSPCQKPAPHPLKIDSSPLINVSQVNKDIDLKNTKNSKLLQSPKVMTTACMKSSPFLNSNKYAFDLSNQNVEKGGKLVSPNPKERKPQTLMDMVSKEKPAKTAQQRKTEVKNTQKQQNKSLSFNKNQMFQNLKKKQQQHSLVTKEINQLGTLVHLILITESKSTTVDLVLVSRIAESKRTSLFLAAHKPTGSLFCLKKQSQVQSLTKQGGLQSLLRQYKVQIVLSHPQIVRAFCALTDGASLFLMMEYMQGQSLAHLLRQNVLRSMSSANSLSRNMNSDSITNKISKLKMIKDCLTQILEAVSYLHSLGITHRDIKPDNILISHDTYKIADFGSCSLSSNEDFVGTLDYAAPEILLQENYNQKVDLWSIGCIIYELDVGRPPFYHISREQTTRLITNAEFDLGLVTDESLRSIVCSLLQRQFSKRPSAKELLQSPFFYYNQHPLSGESIY